MGFARVEEPSQPPPGQIPTTSPVCPIHLLEVLTTCIIDNACVWSNITTAALNRLFPERWQKWVEPTKDALDSASHHPLPIIGRIRKAKMKLGSVQFIHDLQVVKDKEPRFLLGNDVIYDRITIHESRFITVRCRKDGTAKEIIPIQYGAPLMFGITTKDITIRAESATIIQVEVTLDAKAANRVNKNYVQSLEDTAISLENIRYGPDHDGDLTIQIEETVAMVQHPNITAVVVQNTSPNKLKILKGTRIAKVTPIRKVTEGNKVHFVQDQTTDDVTHILKGEDMEESININETTTPNAFYLHSHDEDLINLMEGSPEGTEPLPPGYELPEEEGKRKEYKIEDVKTPYLTEEQRAMMLTVCYRHEQAFAKHNEDVGNCNYEEHDLDVGDAKPIAQPYRPCPRAYVEEAKSIIDNMLKLKIIEESDSEYGQNLVIVRKPSGALRLCVDLRAINAILVPTSKPAWPIPNPEESYEKFATAEYVSKLDLTNAYWCLRLTPRSRKVTAFYFLNRLYHFIRAPFGAANLPSVFARVMQKLTRYYRSFVWSYFDDICIYSTNFSDHLEHLDKILQRIEEAGFKIRADKCRICVPKSEPLDWLGHIICNGQLLCDPKKVEAIRNTPTPRNVDEVIKYASTLQFISRHLPALAQVLHPLYDLKVKANKGEKFFWGPIHETAFQLSKEMVTEAPGLQLPTHDAELIITSDASLEAAAGMMSMKMRDEVTGEEIERPCGYVSRKFTEAERKRQSVPECELTALIFTIKSFAFYLAGKASFTVRTDAASLLYLSQFNGSNSRLMRQSLWLQEYNFKIEHMKCAAGNTMAIADFLSRSYKEEVPISLSWKNLRNRIFSQIKPGPNWPQKPMDKKQFEHFRGIFFESFDPQFPDDTEHLEKLKIKYFLDPTPEKQREIREYENKRLKERQKERYEAIREKLSKLEIDKVTQQGTGKERPNASQGTETQYTNSTRSQGTEISTVQDTDNSEKDVISTNIADPPSENRSNSASWASDQQDQYSTGPEYDSEDTASESSEGHEQTSETAGDQLIPEGENSGRQKGQTTPCFYQQTPSNKSSKSDASANKSSNSNESVEQRVEQSIEYAQEQGLRSPAEMAAFQNADPILQKIIAKIKNPKGKRDKSTHFKIKEEVLLRQRKNKDGTTDWAVAIPHFLQKELMQYIHGGNLRGPHFGPIHMVLAMRPLYYWKGMKEDIDAFCKECIPCQYTKPSTIKQVDVKNKTKTPLVRPGQRLAIDLIVGLPVTEEGYKYILTIIDEFSRYTICVPCKSKRPEEIATLLQERWMTVIGTPETIHSDQGTEVDSKTILNMCKILGIRKTRTPGYNPQSNGLAELANKSIGNLLKASVFPDHQNTRWPSLLAYIVMAYNETPSTSTGYKPRELIFGRIPSYYKLPLVSFSNPIVSSDDFIQSVRMGQEFLWSVVRAQQMQHKDKENEGKEHPFKEGDFVLLKDLQIKGPTQNKFKPKWVGPMRVIRSYPAALLVQQWIGPDKLDHETVLHHHKFSAKHVDARLVHPRNCKPFHQPEGAGEHPTIHPQLISNFLKQLGQKYTLDEETDSDIKMPYVWDITSDKDVLSEVDRAISSRDDRETLLFPMDEQPLLPISDQSEQEVTGTQPPQQHDYERIIEAEGQEARLWQQNISEITGRSSPTQPEIISRNNTKNDGQESQESQTGNCNEELNNNIPTNTTPSINEQGGQYSAVSDLLGKEDNSLAQEGTDNATREVTETSKTPNNDEKLENTQGASGDNEQSIVREEGKEQITPQQQIPNKAEPTRQQPRRVTKSKWQEEEWPRIRRLELSESSKESEGRQATPVVPNTPANENVPATKEETTPQQTKRDSKETLALQQDLERTAKKNLTYNTPPDDNPRDFTAERIQTWIMDEVCPDQMLERSMVNAHERREMDQAIAIATGQEVVPSGQIVNIPEGPSSANTIDKPSTHVYENQ